MESLLREKLDKIVEDSRCKGCMGYPLTPKKLLVDAILSAVNSSKQEMMSEEEIVEKIYKYYAKDMLKGVQGGGCDMGAFARMREDCERLAQALLGKIPRSNVDKDNPNLRKEGESVDKGSVNFICPIMSRNVSESFDTDNPTLMRIVFQKTLCVGKDCALWTIEMGESGRTIERCGMVK